MIDDGDISVLTDGPDDPRPPGGRSRRRRGAALAAVLALVLVALVGLAVRDRGDRQASTPEPSAAAPTVAEPTDEPNHTASSAPALPERRTELPPRLDPDATPAKPLSGNPIQRARLLLQRNTGARTEQPVYALAEDNTWRRIDVGHLLPVTDPHGNGQPTLDVTSLSTDGRRAAFAQRDEVVIVELADASVRRVSVPGFNEDVQWLGERVVVRQEIGAYLIADGQRIELPGPGGDFVVTDAALTQLSADAEYRPVLRSWTAAGPGPEQRVDGVGNLFSWDGPGWQRGRVIARAVVVGTGSPERPTTPSTYRFVLVDTASATARFAVDIGAVPVDYARLLGWYDADTLLVVVEMRRVVAYDLTTGQPAQVTTIAGDRSWLSVSQLAS